MNQSELLKEADNDAWLDIDLRIGCSGWSYKDWVGPFYPKGTPAGEFLSLYSRIFDTVEVNSTFYRIPSPFLVARWRKTTPDTFQFSAKLPKRLTHVKKLGETGSYLDRFYDVMGELGEKLGVVVVQLPPSFKYGDHRDVLGDFLDVTQDDFPHAIEFRHKSWFRSEIYSLLRDNNFALCWSTNMYLDTPSETTSDFMYLRMVGDRSIKSFGKIQKDRSDAMSHWKREMERRSENVKEGFVFFNNHFAGFGPGSANEFRRLLGMMKREWTEAFGDKSSD